VVIALVLVLAVKDFFFGPCVKGILQGFLVLNIKGDAQERLLSFTSVRIFRFHRLSHVYDAAFESIFEDLLGAGTLVKVGG